MNETDLRTIELGHAFTHAELSTYFRAVWGAVSWPGKRPGVAVVVGMLHEPHFDSHDVILVDEYESFDLRQLVRQSGVLDVKYGISASRIYQPNAPGRWIGDFKNDAASRFVEEMNAEQKRDGAEGRELFSLTPTLMLEMENLYSFILPQLKELVSAEHKMLFLKDGKVSAYLSEIQPEEISELQPGDYPAIEALAFAVIELRDHIRAQERTARQPQRSPWDDHVLTRGLRIRR